MAFYSNNHGLTETILNLITFFYYSVKFYLFIIIL